MGQGRRSTVGSLGYCEMQRNESEPQTLICMSKDADWRKTRENSSQVIRRRQKKAERSARRKFCSPHVKSRTRARRIVIVVLPLTTERTGDCAPVVVRQLDLAAGVCILLLPLDHEAVPPVAVRGVKQGALLKSGITPEEVLDIAHDMSILGGSPLSWSVSLVPTALAPRAASSRTVGVQVLVAFFLQRQLQK